LKKNSHSPNQINYILLLVTTLLPQNSISDMNNLVWFVYAFSCA